MTDAERRACADVARQYRVATGAQLIVPRALYDQMVAEGIDVVDFRVSQPLPVAR